MFDHRKARSRGAIAHEALSRCLTGDFITCYSSLMTWNGSDLVRFSRFQSEAKSVTFVGLHCYSETMRSITLCQLQIPRTQTSQDDRRSNNGYVGLRPCADNNRPHSPVLTPFGRLTASAQAWPVAEHDCSQSCNRRRRWSRQPLVGEGPKCTVSVLNQKNDGSQKLATG
jgi:hypothetical protein